MPQRISLNGFVGKMVEKMRTSKGVGTCAGVIRVSDAHSGNGDESKLDRFTVAFPYGGLYVKWEVIFNSNCPSQPPDFIFTTDAQAFKPDIHKLKSLSTWDSRDDSSLLHLMRDLIGQYKQHHLSLLHESSVGSELQALLKFKDTQNGGLEGWCGEGGPDSMEVEVFSSCNENQVHIMTRIPVLLPNLSESLDKHASSHEKLLVLVTYQDKHATAPVSQLFTSPRLEKALTGVGGTPCLTFPKEGGLLLHVTGALNKLLSLVDQLMDSLDKRKKYVIAMVKHFASHVVEYDSSTFHNVNLLFSIQQAHVLLSIDILPSFPATQPHLTFTSMDTLWQERSLVVKRVREYPYSPRWSPEEMAGRMRKYLEDNLDRFEKDMHVTSP